MKEVFPSPSGASIFLIRNHDEFLLLGSWFPSPSGASIFLILRRIDAWYTDPEFPSPSGASIFLINGTYADGVYYYVSVPFRGFYISNKDNRNK